MFLAAGLAYALAERGAGMAVVDRLEARYPTVRVDHPNQRRRAGRLVARAVPMGVSDGHRVLRDGTDCCVVL